jgi:hypothetical protein
MKRVVRLSTAALAALLIGLTPACDKKTTRPVTVTSPALQTIWPNDDGRFWIYRITAREWDDPGGPHFYGDPDSVPQVPPLWYLAQQLGTQPIGPNVVTDTASFQLKFEGQITTQSGVTAQHLTETVLRPAPGPATTLRGSLGPGISSGFLRDLARARPDLAPQIALLPGGRLALADTLITTHATLFLFGYAWKRTTEWIGSYGDVDTLLAWKYLSRNLTPGSEFVQQLVPSLASNIFLRGRILNRQTIVTPAGTYRNAVVCLYSVDYGISTATDDQGNVVGYFRVYSYGTIAYVDGVGPVSSYERRMVGVGDSSLGIFDENLVLTSHGVVAPLATRW